MDFEIKHVDTAEDALKFLAEDGVVVIDNVLDRQAAQHLRAILDEEIERDRAAGILFHDGDDCNDRLLDITARRKEFCDLVEHPLTTAMASNWFKPDWRLSSFGANVTTPGSSSMFIHADQCYVPSPWPPYPLALNLIWALDDFTVERGATHFLPGSHRLTRGPYPGETSDQTMPLLCDAGSVIAMDGKVWHHTGVNTTKDQTRAGLLMYLVNWFILPQSDWPALFGPERRSELSPRMLELLGFGEKASMRLEQFDGA
jgi:fumagillin biosynthesis dioxygenase